MITLAHRRPDLGKLYINTESIDQTIPTLQLVNEVLSAALDTQLGDQPVDEIVSTERYPNTLPYHFAHHQILSATQALQIPWLDLFMQQMRDFPIFSFSALSTHTAAALNKSQALASGLAPEQMKIVNEAPWFSTHLLSLDALENTWGSHIYSTTEVNPWLDLKSHAYITPDQPSLIEGASTLTWSPEKGSTKIKLQLKNAANENASFTLCGNGTEYNVRTVNNAVSTQGAPYKRYLKFVYTQADNPDFNLSAGPWRGDFFVYAKTWYSPQNFSKISFSLVLGEDDTFSLYTPEQRDFYRANYGIMDISQVDFNVLTTLTQHTGLTVPEVEQMFCRTTESVQVVLSSNVTIINNIFNNGRTDQKPYEPYHYGAVFIHANKTPAITLSKEADGTLKLSNHSDDRLDRINRMVRLQRWLQLPFDKVDWLVTAVMRAEGEANLGLEMNDHTLRGLGVYHHYQQQHRVTPEQFAALVHEITPYAISPNKPFLDQIFNTPSLFDQPFIIDWKNFDYSKLDGSRDGKLVKQLCAGLKISAPQFQRLANWVAKHQGDQTATTLPCSLPVVSALYRLAMLPRLVGLSIEDGLALMNLLGEETVMAQLAGIPQVITLQEKDTVAADILTLLLVFSQWAVWLQTHRRSPQLIQAWLAAVPETLAGNTEQLALIKETNQHLAVTLLSIESLSRLNLPPKDNENKDIDWPALFKIQALRDEEGLIPTVTLAAGQTLEQALSARVEEALKTLKLDEEIKIELLAKLTPVFLQAKTTQDNVGVSALAKALHVAQPVPPLLLQWTGHTLYDFLVHTQALEPIDRSEALPQAYLALMYELVRTAVLVTEFELSPAMLAQLLAQPDQFLPAPIAAQDGTALPLSLSVLYYLSRYQDLLHSSASTEDQILPLFMHKGAEDETIYIQLAERLGWDAHEIQNLGPVPAKARLAWIDHVMRMQALSQRTNLSVLQLQQFKELAPDSDYAKWQAFGEAMMAGMQQRTQA